MATKKIQQQVRVSKKQLDVIRQTVKKDTRSNEPKVLDHSNYVVSMIHMLNFYGLEFDTKTKKEWVVNYIKEFDKDIASKLSKLSHQYFTTIGSLVRMKENGVNAKEDLHSRIVAMGSEMAYSAFSEEVDIKVAPQTNNSENKAEIFLGEFEGHLDEAIGNKSLNISNWYKAYSPTKQNLELLMNLIQKKLNEYNSILEDNELLKAYAISKKECRTIIDSFTSAIAELSVSTQRKPRAKKAVSIQSIVAKMQYQAVDNSLGIKSLDPTTILGKNSLILFNTKTKKIQYYVSETGFEVKGTTLLGYDETKSIQKNLRYPKDQLLNLLQLPKRAFEKALGMIKSVTTVPNGRINSDTLLCKIL